MPSRNWWLGFAVFLGVLNAWPLPAHSQQPVSCEATIRLEHVKTGLHLHSHRINYQHTPSSGQQQITAYGKNMGPPNDDDLWVLKPPCAGPVKSGHLIRLQHLKTKAYLHSHPGFPAPYTKTQQEVTGYGGPGQSDCNDNWIVEVEGGGDWTTNKRIRLIHLNTGYALHSHDIRLDSKFPGWGHGQQEVTASSGRDEYDWWQASF
jgi:dolichyl-phosphate-mannose--protein O-mannosyl transferase